MVVGFGILAAIFGIKGGGAHGGAQAGFIILLLFGAPLGAIFGSLLVRKLTGEQESPREKIKHKGFWIALAAVVLVGLGAARRGSGIRYAFGILPGRMMVLWAQTCGMRGCRGLI